MSLNTFAAVAIGVLGVLLGVIAIRILDRITQQPTETVTVGRIGTAAIHPNTTTVPECPPVRINGNLRTRYRLTINGQDAGCRLVGAKP